MKKLLLFALFSFVFQLHYGQQSYTVDGETMELKTEIEGQLDLLWNIINNQYRYFIRTEDGTITELKNTKDADKNYLEEYKRTLSTLTNGKDTQKLKLRLYDLRSFIDLYNASVDSAYEESPINAKVKFRLGVFGGITNNPFVGNPDNIQTLLIGGELEFFEENKLPRHSGFLQGRHTFDDEEFNYSTNELSLGYRYRIINKSTFSIYGQVKLATLNITGFTFENENGDDISGNETSFDVPFIFGLGSDIKVGENSFITIIYGELFALFLDNQGNFSTDIMIGYKFNL